MNDANRSPSPAPEAAAEPPEVEVVIEIPQGSFLKRGSTGHGDFISPLPCPFNYGSVPKFLGLEGNLLGVVAKGNAERPKVPSVRSVLSKTGTGGSIRLSFTIQSSISAAP